MAAISRFVETMVYSPVYSSYFVAELLQQSTRLVKGLMNLDNIQVHNMAQKGICRIYVFRVFLVAPVILLGTGDYGHRCRLFLGFHFCNTISNNKRRCRRRRR